MILTFHGVGEPPPDVRASERPFWVGADVLASTLDEVARRADVSVTFDDGLRSDVEIALPALHERGMSARFFILGGHVDEPGYVTSADVRALAEAGMTIGSHGVHHEPWTSLAPDELRQQLVRSRSVLEDLSGRAVDEASCPFGMYDRTVLRELRRVGFARVYTSDGGPANPAAWLQPRNTVKVGSDPAAIIDDRVSVRTRTVRRAKRIVKRLR